MHGLAVYVKERLPFTRDFSLENTAGSCSCFRWFYFTQCVTSFLTVDQLVCIYAQLSMLFNLTQTRFSRSTNLLMCLSFETLTSIIGTGKPVFVELIDLVYSLIISVCQMTLLGWLTFQVGFLTVTLIILLFWIY